MQEHTKIIRKRYILSGQVQGVGFRPFVFRIAHAYALSGFVSNSSEGVIIEVQGSAENIALFTYDLENKLPPMAIVENFSSEQIPCIEEDNFSIKETDKDNQEHSILIGADMAHCEDCKREMLDESDKRYLYPFINCTNCGPRYSITHVLPYDRAQTSMASFKLCTACEEEYHNPLDRRFHAQPTACHECGVKLWTETDTKQNIEGIEALKLSIERLNSGKILAIKGIGGFHLACDATNYESIKILRERKNRPHKALALMVKDIDIAKEFAYIDQVEENLLTSPRRPIVLCKKRQSHLASNINQDTDFIGLMLPSSPLHELLFFDYGIASPKALVMTSGNSAHNPIALDNSEAKKMLENIADYFLFHNRDILVRVDDSLIMPKPKEIRHLDENKNPYISIRRARGYVPEALKFPLPQKSSHVILALGADLKATLCYTKGDKAFVGQHIGNMENLENQLFMQENSKHLENILATKADCICIDAHPNAHMRAFAEDYAKKHSAKLFQIQHHKAHAYALLADNALTETTLVLSLDGAGYGDDSTGSTGSTDSTGSTIWGGELLLAHPYKAHSARIGSFESILQPAYDKASLNPYYMTESYLYKSTYPYPENIYPSISHEDRSIVQELCQANMGFQTSSCGRLFDAIGALLGCATSITYEGQTAMQLEALQDKDFKDFDIVGFTDKDNISRLDTQTIFDNCLNKLSYLQEKNIDNIFAKTASYFHLSLAHSLSAWAIYHAKALDIKNIGLTGGVFLNNTLLITISQDIEKSGLNPILHKNYPTGDANISLGQAYYVYCTLNN